jgi:hypothetical protein
MAGGRQRVQDVPQSSQRNVAGASNDSEEMVVKSTRVAHTWPSPTTAMELSIVLF